MSWRIQLKASGFRNSYCHQNRLNLSVIFCSLLLQNKFYGFGVDFEVMDFFVAPFNSDLTFGAFHHKLISSANDLRVSKMSSSISLEYDIFPVFESNILEM